MFEQLLEELGRLLHMTLQSDSNHTCLLQFGPKLQVHIEPDREDSFVIFGIALGHLDSGSFREKVAVECLKYNAGYGAHPGILAYNEKNNSLVFFDACPINTPVPVLHQILLEMVQKASSWITSLEQGQIPEFPPIDQNASEPSPFSLVRTGRS